MSNRRQSWKPGDPTQRPAAQSPKGTMVVRAGDIKRHDTPEQPEAKDLPDLPEEPEETGTSRGLPEMAAPPPTPNGDDDRAPVASPFAAYAPSAQQLSESAAAGAESSNQILAIVFGLGFAIVSALLGAFVILLLGLFAWYQIDDGDGLAGADKDKEHIRDTAVAGDLAPLPKPRRPSPSSGDPDDTDVEEDAGPITTGPVSVRIPKTAFFHTMEINCPDAQIRRRAPFRRQRAYTTGVPIHEECTLTFQGSEPAVTTISGGQDKECVTFNPTECRLL